MQKLLTKSGKLVIPLVILGLLTVLGFSLSKKTLAPDVTFTTIQGKTIKMDELKGKVVLVNFWATDCPGCIAEMPQLIKTYQQYHPQGFEVIAVAMFYDPPDHVLNYAQKHALPFPVMHDGYGEIAKSFEDVRLTPTSFIMDKQGRVIQRVVGELDFNSLHGLLAEQLGKNS
jgi:peroxiredoxin